MTQMQRIFGRERLFTFAAGGFKRCRQAYPIDRKLM